jgi:hypothetical protein
MANPYRELSIPEPVLEIEPEPKRRSEIDALIALGSYWGAFFKALENTAVRQSATK